MNVSLTKHQESFLASLVESGRYQNASEAVRRGIRLLQDEEGERYTLSLQGEKELLEDLQGPVTPMTKKDWEDGRRKLKSYINDQKRKNA